MKKQTSSNNTVVITDNNAKESNILQRGTRDIRDLLAPSIVMSGEFHKRIGNHYFRAFALKGYPNGVDNGWLDALYNYDGDMDVCVDIEPADERRALDDLTNKITQYEAQYQTDSERGNIKNSTALASKISALYQQRAKLEQNVENMFHVSVLAGLFSTNEADLNKEAQKLESRLTGRKILLDPLYLRQDAGFRSLQPFTPENQIQNYYRNLNTGALSTMFPFYNSEISHRNGILFAINRATATPIFIDMYNKDLLDNANISVLGKSGSGKTYFVSLLTLRSALSGIRTVILDPENEYGPVTDRVDGVTVVIAPSSPDKEQPRMNPFDIEEEEELDDNGKPTGRIVVNLKDKIASLLNLITVMCQGIVSPDIRSEISETLAETYAAAGITENPNSLYIEADYFDRATGLFNHGKKKKPMPTLSDFYILLQGRAEVTQNPELQRCVTALRMFVSGGIYDLFDGHTNVDIDFNKAPVVRFDLSKLEEDILRPIGMFVALQWSWEMFAKKNPYIRKRIIVDEAWMFIKTSMAGGEYTANFLETCARRIRKRNGGLCVASQGVREFANSPQGQAVLQSTTVKCLMKQDSADIKDVQDIFQLSDGEREYLLGLSRGEMLIKMNQESSEAYVFSFDFERDLIKRDYLQ